MRRLLPGILAFGVFALVVFLAFGVEPARPDAAPAATAPAPAPTPPAPVAAQVAPTPAPSVETAPKKPQAEELVALRRYEHLLNGRRLGAYEVHWFRSRAPGSGGWTIRDVTRHRTRMTRMMGRVPDTFKQDTVSTTVRTENGDLIRMESEVRMPSRIDSSTVVRGDDGYHVSVRAGSNEETFVVATDRPAVVDPEAFLAARIARGEVRPGSTWSYLVLDAGGRRMRPVTLEVVGPDREGPGLKVLEKSDGRTTLWWFADDGSVVRVRSGTTIIRRDDEVGLGDLPRRAATSSITLPVDVRLPRIFTCRSMVVDVIVDTDETLQPPRIAPNPFTEMVERDADRVRLKLTSHDRADATCPLPIDPERFRDELKATPLMEVDHPVVKEAARDAMGDAADARSAARNIANWVFHRLRKSSPDIPNPTALQILKNPIGDCSEHSLLFTALCRAGGIPARRCSGYVNIGSDWGAHGWAEVWVGEWIGADPTTNEIGTRARYIFLARPDDPDVRPASMIAERTRIRTLRVQYDDGELAFGDEPKMDAIVSSGIRVGPLPGDWSAEHSRGSARLQGPGFRARAWLEPDHGYRTMAWMRRRYRSGRQATFGAHTAYVVTFGTTSRWIVPLGREILYVQVDGRTVPIQELADVLEPTLARGD